MSTGMKRWLLAGAVLALVAACTAPPRPDPEVNRYGVHVAAEHSGSSIALEPGQELVVRLASLLGPSTEWSIVDFKPGVLTGPSAPRFEPEKRMSQLNEPAAGFEVWRFKPAAPGTVTLKFEYRRIRSLDPATETVTYTVTVR